MSPALVCTGRFRLIAGNGAAVPWLQIPVQAWSQALRGRGACWGAGGLAPAPPGARKVL